MEIDPKDKKELLERQSCWNLQVGQVHGAHGVVNIPRNVDAPHPYPQIPSPTDLRPLPSLNFSTLSKIFSYKSCNFVIIMSQAH